jgi:Flp pilus assembly protein TadD
LAKPQPPAGAAVIAPPPSVPRYSPEEIEAMIGVGYHYLRNGGHELARTVFAGLAELAPDRAYVWLALGLTEDHLDDREAARRAYHRAGALDPGDPRPDLNLAELDLVDELWRDARSRLQVALQKSIAHADARLEAKARALLSLPRLQSRRTS